jgi:hypothetical protein
LNSYAPGPGRFSIFLHDPRFALSAGDDVFLRVDNTYLPLSARNFGILSTFEIDLHAPGPGLLNDELCCYFNLIFKVIYGVNDPESI